MRHNERMTTPPVGTWWRSARYLVAVPVCIVIAAIGRGLAGGGNDSLISTLVIAGLVGVGIALFIVAVEQTGAARVRAIAKRYPGAVVLIDVRPAPPTAWVINHLIGETRVSSQMLAVAFDDAGMHVLSGYFGRRDILHVRWELIGGFFGGTVRDELGRLYPAVLVSIATTGRPTVLPFAWAGDHARLPFARGIDSTCAQLESMLAVSRQRG